MTSGITFMLNLDVRAPLRKKIIKNIMIYNKCPVFMHCIDSRCLQKCNSKLPSALVSYAIKLSSSQTQLTNGRSPQYEGLTYPHPPSIIRDIKYIYLEYQVYVPSLKLRLPTLSPASECAPPPGTKGGAGGTLACGWGRRGVPVPTTIGEKA